MKVRRYKKYLRILDFNQVEHTFTPITYEMISYHLPLTLELKLNSDHQADPTKRRISQNVSASDHTRSVLKIRLNGYPFSVIGTS